MNHCSIPLYTLPEALLSGVVENTQPRPSSPGDKGDFFAPVALSTIMSEQLVYSSSSLASTYRDRISFHWRWSSVSLYVSSGFAYSCTYPSVVAVPDLVHSPVEETTPHLAHGLISISPPSVYIHLEGKTSGEDTANHGIVLPEENAEVAS